MGVECGLPCGRWQRTKKDNPTDHGVSIVHLTPKE